MKLAIYGVSRAGKDHLIKNVIAHLQETTLLTAIHIEGSKTLNTLAQEMFQKPLKVSMNQTKILYEKNSLRL